MGITKAEVQRLILNQSHLNNNQSIQNKSVITSMSNKSKIAPLSAHNDPLPTISTIGSKTNPLYMKRQTSLKEFIFSLFPFLFIFWMLGGFDLVRNRKQGGVGGMFGNNYSEWDEEDWEDDEEDEEITNDEGNILTNKQKEELKRKKEEQIKQEQDEMDKRTSFFKKLGIDLSDTKDENKENV